MSGPLGSARWTGPTPASVHGWRHFQVPIEQSAWQLTGGNWIDLIHGVGRFEIRVRQFSNTDQSEVMGLDSVRVGVVPEPATGVMLVSLGGLAMMRRRRKALS